MKDEIKEILDVEKYRNKDGYVENISLLPSEIYKLLDCITNLQEELKETADLCSKHFVKIQTLKTNMKELQQKYENSQITLAEEWKKRLEIEEENKHLDNQITMLKQQNNAITEIGLGYKSRNEKVIKLLKQAGSYDEETKQFCDDVWEELPDILNVLEGGNK